MQTALKSQLGRGGGAASTRSSTSPPAVLSLGQDGSFGGSSWQSRCLQPCAPPSPAPCHCGQAQGEPPSLQWPSAAATSLALIGFWEGVIRSGENPPGEAQTKGHTWTSSTSRLHVPGERGCMYLVSGTGWSPLHFPLQVQPRLLPLALWA